MRDRQATKERAVGRWRSILTSLGLTPQQLSGKHCPCPLCGGKDRFRFDDKAGNGTWFCNQCGAGDGIGLVMRINRVAFKDACKSIESFIPGASVTTRSATTRVNWAERGLNLWAQCRPLDGFDAASLYLRRRGIDARPAMLRFSPRYGYVHEDKRKTTHQAMVARFVSPDASQSTFHITYLDGSGRKADVPTVKKLWPGAVPDGGAVRLAPSADTMGIAEGIETAMSAALIFGVPVWAALNSGNLMKWQPPATARNIIVFGDNDESFDGQCKAYALAHRLKLSGLNVDVRLPDFEGDWNDHLLGMTSVQAEAAE